jgi:alkylation response protein AidB-like acyl-CoA dehydrogenase
MFVEEGRSNGGTPTDGGVNRLGAGPAGTTESAALLEAAQLLVLRAAFLKEQGRPFTREASMGKLYATEAANRACYKAVQILGGYGYTAEYPVERLARDVRVTTLYEGTSEIQRLVIARELLGG